MFQHPLNRIMCSPSYIISSLSFRILGLQMSITNSRWDNSVSYLCNQYHDLLQPIIQRINRFISNLNLTLVNWFTLDLIKLEFISLVFDCLKNMFTVKKLFKMFQNAIYRIYSIHYSFIGFLFDFFKQSFL